MTGHTVLSDDACIRNEINLPGCTMMYKSGRLLLCNCVLCLANKCDIISIVVCSQKLQGIL